MPTHTVFPSIQHNIATKQCPAFVTEGCTGTVDGSRSREFCTQVPSSFSAAHPNIRNSYGIRDLLLSRCDSMKNLTCHPSRDLLYCTILLKQYQKQITGISA